MLVASARYLAVFCLALNTITATAQAYDPEKGSPVSLLAGPKDGVAYYEMRKQVGQLAIAGKAAEAEPLIEQLVRDYPRDGENWMLLGRVKRALNKPADAAAAFDKAADILGRRAPWNPEITIASLHLAAGNKSAALDVLRRAVFDDHTIVRDKLFDAPALAPLRADSAFRAIAGRPDTTGVSREEGWRRDLDYLYSEALRVSPDYQHGGAPPAFTRAYEQLRKDIPRLSPEEFVVGLNRMLATLHQAHTDLWGFHGPWAGRVGYLPVQFYVFPEGIFIVDASDKYQSLIGTRLVSIGRTAAEDALRLVNRMQSVDADMDYLNTGAFLLRTPPYLRGSGIDIPADSVPITVESPDGQRRTVKLIGQDFQGWGYTLPLPPRVQPPMFLRNTQKNYWEQPLPEHDALYVQFNQFQNDSSETLPAYGVRLWNVLETQKPRNLILDVRHNNGGNILLSPELLRTIIAYTRAPDHRLYVLIGRETFSAAALLITDLERLANPVFVGEASRECCSLHGNAASVQLTYSGLSGRVSGARWNLSGDVFDGRREMSPHVPVQLTAAAYFAGLDPALDAVFRLIDRAKR
jgi:tetratricopeptide (TPR) repeat protein